MKKRLNLTKVILLAFEKSIDGYIRLEDFTYNTHIYAGGYDRPLNQSSLSKALKRLIEKGWIDFVDDKQIVFRLTENGANEVLWARINEEEKWDGKWRFVIFDIPEERRVVRDLLRYKLKQLGFKAWQQSVWVTKKNCTKPLRSLIKKIGIEDWVMVIESDNIK